MSANTSSSLLNSGYVDADGPEFEELPAELLTPLFVEPAVEGVDDDILRSDV